MNNERIEINPGISLGRIFKKSFELYGKHFIDFISLSLIYALAVAIIRVIVKKIGGGETNAIFMTVIFNTLILCRVSVALIYMASQKIEKKEIDVSRAFADTQGFYPNYLMVYSFVFFLMGLGFLLFIIPGFYVGTIFLFADALVVLEKKNVPSSFSRSRQLVEKHFGIVFLFLTIIILISLSPVIFLKILGPSYINLVKNFSDLFSALFIPFYMIAQVELYQQIKERMRSIEAF